VGRAGLLFAEAKLFNKFERVFVLELVKMLAAKEIHVPLCPFFTPNKDVETAILLDPVCLMSVRVCKAKINC